MNIKLSGIARQRFKAHSRHLFCSVQDRRFLSLFLRRRSAPGCSANHGARVRGIRQNTGALVCPEFRGQPAELRIFRRWKQKVELMWQAALFITTISVFLAPFSLGEVLLNYTVSYSVLYVIYLLLAYRFSKNFLQAAGRLDNSQFINGG